MSFLKAEWKKLIMINYVVPEELILPYVPKKAELDLWEGKCYVSLVGFLFRNTRVKGVAIPGHINFEEVNLRFYVKRRVNGETRRGVVFIKEIVPRRMITFVANRVYKENYVTRKMRHQVNESDREVFVEYAWKEKNKRQYFNVSALTPPVHFHSGSEEEFITEHYWGYAKHGNSYTNEYEVTHPKWQIYPVIQFQIQVDFDYVYGSDFKILNELTPASVFLAEGSLITVERQKKIR